MDYNKLIAAKERDALKHLSFSRVRKSRLWLRDNGWWSVVVEFQPSSFSKGTYVNVAVSHLLYESCGWTFNISRGLPGFASAEDDVAFESKVEDLAQEAATVATSLQSRYQSVANSLEWYRQQDRRSVWDEYYAGVLSSFLGEHDNTSAFFEVILANEYERSWEQAVQARAAALSFLLQDVDK